MARHLSSLAGNALRILGVWERGGGWAAISPAPPSRSSRSSPRGSGLRSGAGSVRRPAPRAGSGLGPKPLPRGQSGPWGAPGGLSGPAASSSPPRPPDSRGRPRPQSAGLARWQRSAASLLPGGGAARRGECLRGAGRRGWGRPLCAAKPGRGGGAATLLQGRASGQRGAPSLPGAHTPALARASGWPPRRERGGRPLRGAEVAGGCHPQPRPRPRLPLPAAPGARVGPGGGRAGGCDYGGPGRAGGQEQICHRVGSGRLTKSLAGAR